MDEYAVLFKAEPGEYNFSRVVAEGFRSYAEAQAYIDSGEAALEYGEPDREYYVAIYEPMWGWRKVRK